MGRLPAVLASSGASPIAGARAAPDGMGFRLDRRGACHSPARLGRDLMGHQFAGARSFRAGCIRAKRRHASHRCEQHPLVAGNPLGTHRRGVAVSLWAASSGRRALDDPAARARTGLWARVVGDCDSGGRRAAVLLACAVGACPVRSDLPMDAALCPGFPFRVPCGRAGFCRSASA